MNRLLACGLFCCFAVTPVEAYLHGSNVTAAVTAAAVLLGLCALLLGSRRDPDLTTLGWLLSWRIGYLLLAVYLLLAQAVATVSVEMIFPPLIVGLAVVLTVWAASATPALFLRWMSDLLLLALAAVFLILLVLSVFHTPDSDAPPDDGAMIVLAVIGLLAIGGYALHRKAREEQRLRGRPYFRTIVFLLLLISVPSLLTLFAVDRLLHLLLRRSMNLVLPANVTIVHATSEFRCTVTTNSLGFRDREVPLRTKHRHRAIALGDSFTYGWGVEGEQAWPKVLEADLFHAGRDVEVLNLGCQGTSPTEYAEIARRAIPVLSPEVVLVCVLQGDDLMQENVLTYREEMAGPAARHEGPFGQFLRSGMEMCFPQLYASIREPDPLKPNQLLRTTFQDTYKNQVEQLMRQMSREQAERFAAMDEDVRQMFREGNLNPHLLGIALQSANYYAFTLDLSRPKVQQAIQRMGEKLTRIREAAAAGGAKVIVLAAPADMYTTSVSRVRKMGFRLPDSAVGSPAPDEAIAEACRLANVPFHCVTSAFRQAAGDKPVYFPYDGHWTPRGHELFARALAESGLLRDN
jgi:hypothetical protein